MIQYGRILPLNSKSHRLKSLLTSCRWRSTWSIDPLTGILSRPKRPDDNHQFQAILGVEIHAQLDISTKLFSTAPSVSTITSQPNTAVHPFDCAVPGILPSLSIEAVQAAVMAAHLLDCEIQTTSRFERKHYAYADLPHGYQITQQRWPLAINGVVHATFNPAASNNHSIKKKKEPPRKFSCRIHRIQLEQDSGKTVQVWNPETGVRESRVDFNRAGQALIEIVSQPDLRTPQQASALVEHVRQLFKHVGICNGRMEEGSLRCDLNVNLQNLHSGERSARVEVKNLNSLRQITEAAVYELQRHAEEWPMTEETRTWDVASSQTELIRRKDQAEDYRFMPEPDLPPLVLHPAVLDGLSLPEFLETRIPELPAQAKERIIQNYSLTEYQAQVITGDPPSVLFLDASIATAQQLLEETSERQHKRAIETTTNFLINDLFGLVKEHSINEAEASMSESLVSPEQLGQVIAMILNGRISTTMAKNLLHLLYTTEQGGQPELVAANQGWQLITDPAQLRSLCEQVMQDHPEELVTYRKGGKFETKIFKFLTGQVMAKSRGTAEPERVKDILQRLLDDLES